MPSTWPNLSIAPLQQPYMPWEQGSIVH
jgi:hypothetical protein